jgi:hypothetical protein
MHMKCNQPEWETVSNSHFKRKRNCAVWNNIHINLCIVWVDKFNEGLHSRVYQAILGNAYVEVGQHQRQYRLHMHSRRAMVKNDAKHESQANCV